MRTPAADLAGRQAALVIVLHHVLADGAGGLAVLAGPAHPGPGLARSIIGSPGAG
ncbi:hypothetical protein [Lentzea aerocolonigenes]|uniref:hypothetical protein n=1 Tax=Lentzea aerocolonigenes TaxID=68170 RepID=UPI000A7957FD|nr:hypothetical protein [Lentzea aerocolonigenes]